MIRKTFCLGVVLSILGPAPGNCQSLAAPARPWQGSPYVNQLEASPDVEQLVVSGARARREHKFIESLRLLNEALNLSHKIGDKMGKAMALSNIGLVWSCPALVEGMLSSTNYTVLFFKVHWTPVSQCRMPSLVIVIAFDVMPHLLSCLFSACKAPVERAD